MKKYERKRGLEILVAFMSKKIYVKNEFPKN